MDTEEQQQDDSPSSKMDGLDLFQSGTDFLEQVDLEGPLSEAKKPCANDISPHI